MLGTEFTRTLRAAQAGDEAAFVRLFRDANPAIVRYLRVAGVDDPYDAACEGWVTVVRGLPGFTGDETAWRVWLFACARMRAEEGALRRAWSAVTVLPGEAFVPDGEALEVDELVEAEDEVLLNRGVNETIAAISDLPLGQGEVLMLRLAGGLPVSAVADVVGTDALSVRRSETRALERLQAGRELVEWSLTAEATPAELADERVALGAFHSLPKSSRTSSTRVIAIGPAAVGVTGLSRGRRDTAVRLGRHGRSVARHSRTAVLGVAVASASVVSLGGISAAAYVGALPEGAQQVMHNVIGAPAPGSRNHGVGSHNGGTPGSDASSAARGRGPDAASPAPLGLCRAWQVDNAKGTSRDKSVAFRDLASAAGGAAKVDGYCAVALARHPLATKPAKAPKSRATTATPTTPTKQPKTPPVKPTHTAKTPTSTSSLPDSGATSVTTAPRESSTGKASGRTSGSTGKASGKTSGKASSSTDTSAGSATDAGSGTDAPATATTRSSSGKSSPRG